MYVSDQHLTALKAVCRKYLLTNLGMIAAAILASVLFIGTGPGQANPLFLTVSLGLAALFSVTEYFVERALHKQGRGSGFVYLIFFILPLLILESMSHSELFADMDGTGILFAVFFLFFRPLISLLLLISDSGLLRAGTPLEAIGRMRKDSHRDGDAPGRDICLLFEDELTHKALMLHTKEISPDHRYRVWYLPRTGLAVSEPIPDDAEFDPFGNLIQHHDPFATDTDNSTDGFGSAADTEGSPRPDPNSPDRRRAAQWVLWSRICKVLSIGMLGLGFVLAAVSNVERDAPYAAFFLILPAFGLMLLSGVCKSRELKIRCTVSTTARCVDTVRRRSGKHSLYYPIVEFEVDGVPYTVELTVTCSDMDIGELYTIFYDPLDPHTVRAGKRGPFD